MGKGSEQKFFKRRNTMLNKVLKYSILAVVKEKHIKP